MSSLNFQVISLNAFKLLDFQIKALPQEGDQYESDSVTHEPIINHRIISPEPVEKWIASNEERILPNFEIRSESVYEIQ